MIIDNNGYRSIIDNILKPIVHPDPLGFVARILLTSGGEENYIDETGRVGLLPVDPVIASELTGSTDISTVNGNVSTVAVIDKIYFDDTKSIEGMISLFHFGKEIPETSKERQFISDVNELRVEVNELVYPRKATVKDVIDMLLDDVNLKITLNENEKEFFSYLFKTGAVG